MRLLVMKLEHSGEFDSDDKILGYLTLGNTDGNTTVTSLDIITFWDVINFLRRLPVPNEAFPIQKEAA
jgi:hypothetical protein